MSSSKKDEKSLDTTEKLKAVAMGAAKGLSRAQAERAAAAAVRNVNAYGQKEEGPSRWQERKEAKRQMYLMSTEKQVRLGERKDLKTSMSTASGPASQCQKCFQSGHWTYECKNERVYISRPSRTQQLKNPKLRMKVSVSYELDNPDILQEELKAEKDTKKRKSKKDKRSSKRSKRKHSDSSEDSVFESDSGSSSVTGSDGSSSESDSSSSYSSSSSDSEEERRKRKKRSKKPVKRSHRRRHSSSSESDSESEEDRSSRKKKKSKGSSKRC